MSAEVQVQLFGTLRSFRPIVADSHSVVQGTNVGEVLSELHIPLEKVHLIFVNDVPADLAAPVCDGDVLSLFPLLGGG